MTELNQDIRRKYPRVAFAGVLGVLFSGQYKVYRGIEIGEGGLSFFSDQMIMLAQKLVVTILIPDVGYKSVIAEVRNQKATNDQYFIGVQFIDPPFELKRLIRSVVSKADAI